MKIDKITVDNAHLVRLQKLFNYQAIDFVPLRETLRFWRIFNGRKDHYYLGEIYNEYRNGLTVDEVLDKYPDLTLKSALYSHAFYTANHPQQTSKRKHPVSKALVDENIAVEHSVHGAAEVLGKATHIVFEGLRTKKDSAIWVHALVHGFDFIITKDKACKESRDTMETLDITRCAELRWRSILNQNGGVVTDALRQMPKIIHVPHDMTPTQIKNLLRKQQRQIYAIDQECVSPVIDLTRKVAKPGKHFMEIYRGGDRSQTLELRDLRVDVLYNQLDMRQVEEADRKEIKASLKRAVEHEISVELSSVPGKTNKVLFLIDQVDNFNPHEYKYSGDFSKYHIAVKTVKIFDPCSMSSRERLERIRRGETRYALA